MSTGIPILDAILRIGGAFFITWLLLASMKRMVKMYQDHAYAQMAASIIFFCVAYAFVAAPDRVTGVISKVWDTIFGQL